jgi:hypothetical protein
MYGMAAVELNNAIYIIGGSTDPGGFTASKKVYRYFPGSGTFDADTIASLPEARGFLSACVLEGVIFAIGGADGFLGAIKKDVYVYDPAVNVWTTVKPLDQGIAGHSTVKFRGTIYLIGGTSDWNNGSDQVLAFDFQTGNWWPQANSMNHARVLHGSTILNNTIYAFGGIASNSSDELTVEMAPAIPEDSPWEVVGEIPYNRRSFGYAAVGNGGGDSYIYIFGGNSGSAILKSTQRFLPLLVDVEEAEAQDVLTSNNVVKAMPNPFSGTTTLVYEVKKSAQVNLLVYNMSGTLVAHPVKTHQLPGEYKVLFDGSNLEPGVYYCELNTGQGESGMTKVVVMK